MSDEPNSYATVSSYQIPKALEEDLGGGRVRLGKSFLAAAALELLEAGAGERAWHDCPYLTSISARIAQAAQEAQG